ncbi:pyruvate-flavodoxin oxidoreductase-related [Anaeramoeba flamelloides]|uniref:Pyruvate-flavodoxin oxidoreductase-related n=1 Tax=Anaeramoeba flamelloides TaxID=1746091 RepID=A0ABQ8YJY4_9EUKA|nr:pyruvate-flavodoxin oxidoreductase-related [Anaeramoeba flamelloides]
MLKDFTSISKSVEVKKLLRFSTNTKKKSKKVPMDGNTAATYVSYRMSDLAIIYPITPATNMGEYADKWSAEGLKNIFGQELDVTEMQSEGGASGALHGAATSGALTTTYTSSQGLLLMIPNMYKLAGERLPTVFHVASRVVGGQGLSIFCDHSDVMATRQTGFAFMCCANTQEVLDLALICHLATIKTSIPFLNFFDGFRISHEISDIELISDETMKKFVDWDALKYYKQNSLNPEHPEVRGTVQSTEVYFQHLEATNKFYDSCPDQVQDYMDLLAKETGRQYHVFDYHGHPEAEQVIVAMGSGVSPVEEYLDKFPNKKIGLIKVRLFRPWSKKHFHDQLPSTCKRVVVLDRVKEHGSSGEPLFLDVASTLIGTGIDVVGGRYGISGKEFTPAMVEAVYKNSQRKEPRRGFTIGIIDDMTRLSLDYGEPIDCVPEGTTQCVFWGIGGDGTVGANKNAIKIITENTDLHGQGYFVYSAHKSGGVTVSHLRFGPKKITSSYLVTDSNYTAVHYKSYIGKYDLLKTAKYGSTLVLNTDKLTLKELEESLPGSFKQEIAKKNLKLYVIDASEIAQKVGLGERVNMIMQAVFFKLSGVLPVKESMDLLKKAIKKEYLRKGMDIVQKNYNAVDLGIESIIEMNYDQERWSKSEIEKAEKKKDEPWFIENIMRPLLKLEGDKLPVSKLMNGGRMPPGTSKYEKRGFAISVPKWHPENCIQCNLCSLVCPHGVVRPFLLTKEEVENAPQKMQTIKATGLKDKKAELEFLIQVSPYDCTGCTNCTNVCPRDCLPQFPTKREIEEQGKNWEYVTETVPFKLDQFKRNTVKGSQFHQPLFEVSGACAGCGETPAIKLVTQLFGPEIMVANASGCSSVYGGTYPWNPYTNDRDGIGVAWSNSLFEDNAEFGLGMVKSMKHQRSKLKLIVNDVLKNENEHKKEFIDLLKEWLEQYSDLHKSFKVSKKIKKYYKEHFVDLNGDFINNSLDCNVKQIWDRKDMLAQKSQWIIGGDGWAYDIGYGGLDHILASEENLNILVLDTEVYSNTGGQASKSTPRSGVAQFTANGKATGKKDLGLIAMTYGNVYVAYICPQANPNQAVKALKEAGEWPGVSLVISYAPCIAHGIKNGLGRAAEHTKEAVRTGYVHLYRFNPRNFGTNKNPFTIDSKKPKPGIEKFLMKQNRFASLKRSFPEEFEKKQKQLAQDCKNRYESYLSFKEMYGKDLKKK